MSGAPASIRNHSRLSLGSGDAATDDPTAAVAKPRSLAAWASVLFPLAILTLVFLAPKDLRKSSPNPVIVYNHAKNAFASKLYIARLNGRPRAMPKSDGGVLLWLVGGWEGIVYFSFEDAGRGKTAVRLLTQTFDGSKPSALVLQPDNWDGGSPKEGISRKESVASMLFASTFLGHFGPPNEWLGLESVVPTLPKRMSGRPITAKEAVRLIARFWRDRDLEAKRIKKLAGGRERAEIDEWTESGGGGYLFIKGKNLGYVTGRLRRIYPLGNFSRTRHQAPSMVFSHYSPGPALGLLPGRRFMAYTADDKAFITVDLRSGDVRRRALPGGVFWIAPSPDGEWAVMQPRFEVLYDGYVEPVKRAAELPGKGKPADDKERVDIVGAPLPLTGYYLMNLKTGETRRILKGKAVGRIEWFPDSRRFIARTGQKRTDLGLVDIQHPESIETIVRDVNQWQVWFPRSSSGTLGSF